MSENSITVTNVSKKFKVYHEKRTTLFESITGSINRKPHHETLQVLDDICLLYTSPSPRDRTRSRMPSSA